MNWSQTAGSLTKNELVKKGVTIPYFYITGLSEVDYGAHPTSCYPMYGYDREHTALYYDAAKKGTEIFNDEYLNKYVFTAALNEDYLKAVGGEETLKKLEAWDTSTEAWMELYA